MIDGVRGQDAAHWRVRRRDARGRLASARSRSLRASRVTMLRSISSKRFSEAAAGSGRGRRRPGESLERPSPTEGVGGGQRVIALVDARAFTRHCRVTRMLQPHETQHAATEAATRRIQRRRDHHFARGEQQPRSPADSPAEGARHRLLGDEARVHGVARRRAAVRHRDLDRAALPSPRTAISRCRGGS